MPEALKIVSFFTSSLVSECEISNGSLLTINVYEKQI